MPVLLLAGEDRVPAMEDEDAAVMRAPATAGGEEEVVADTHTLTPAGVVAVRATCDDDTTAAAIMLRVCACVTLVMVRV